ncbi:hypothetical protein [Alkalihalobacillus sp. AL-G]|uniref:hypothetical protein n=1 Tax=Alkalihalobacillus sp. AL-G TaxID=2926399 RepID=UPI00272C0998|nr:hypothetical protein [Alkalihalobacillus sp. AL-G]WLD94758.1 hypothetical protein MOJ78_07710 [Alkalihalobacillus sp. AL-G]
MDPKKKKQLNTLLSWGTGVGIAFLFVGDTVLSSLMGWGFVLLFGGTMIWSAVRGQKTKSRKT